MITGVKDWYRESITVTGLLHTMETEAKVFHLKKHAIHWFLDFRRFLM